MRIKFLALAIVISGMCGSLQASHRPLSSIHKVRKGETAARIARDNGLTLGELSSLNPRVNFAHLRVGTALKVAEPRRAAVPMGRPATGPVRVKSLNPAGPVAPLPATPAIGSAPLVHLERILPFEGLAPAPIGATGPGRSSVEPSAATPSLAGLRKVLPQDPQEEDSDEVVAVPPGTGSTEFQPADRDNLDLLWPVETRTISSAWGPRMRTRVVRVRTSSRSRKVLRRFLGNHKGVDLSAPKGTDIFAALDGQVVSSGKQKEYGNFVAIDHGNGVVTLYAHCNRNFVTVGEIVRRGQKIAEVGRTGNATGPHLHFELRLDGIPQNPLPKMNDTEEIPADLMARNQLATPSSAAR